MKRPSMFSPKVLSPREPGQKVEYKPRLYEKLRKITITDVPTVVLVAKSGEANVLFPTSKVFNTIELLEAILSHLSYQELNCAYYACKGFQDVVNNSVKLRQALFLAPDPVSLSEARVLPIKIFYPPHYLWPHLNMRSTLLCLKTNHWYERLGQPPQLKLLDRFITQPPFQYMEIWIGVRVPATKKRHQKMMYVSNDNGIKLADLLNGINRCLSELFPEPPPPHWTVSGVFERGYWMAPLGQNVICVP